MFANALSYCPDHNCAVAALLGANAGPDEALTFTVSQGSAVVYGAGVDNSGHGLTLQIATPIAE